MMRTPNNSDINTDLKKGSWSVEEDHKLISYISRYGIWNWSQMPRFAGLSRSGKSCRLRWMNYLKPNIKRGNFSKEEEETILLYHSILGNKWSAIASRLPGRTDNEVKNHWHAHLKKRVTHYNMPKTTDRNEKNASLKLKHNQIEKIEQPASHKDDVFELSMTCEDIFSCSSSTSNDEANFRADYYDVGSPGTVDDLRCFWQQLCEFENLELENGQHDMFSNSIMNQDSCNSFFDNEHDIFQAFGLNAMLPNL